MTHLRYATVPELDSMREALGDQVVYRRARHVIMEGERTVAVVDHIRVCQYAEAGSSCSESHESLCDDYVVSTPDLDHLVETARGCEGVFGARMTGGFCGRIVALM
ncbi:hypothetical protein PF008_g29282 [Phytophthora fragariae]|nr:hypothetical protein PF008_g29282 [Phytophthora fragariae]